MRSAWVIPLLPLALLTGCTTGPYTGQVVSTDTAGYQFSFGGATDTSGATISTFVLSNPNNNPVNGPFTLLKNQAASTSPQNANDSVPYFSWSQTSPAMTNALWPVGGLVRVKARSKYNGSSTVNDMYSFDSYSIDTTGQACWLTEVLGGTAWRQAGSDCRAPYAVDQVITVVSTFTTPDDLHGDFINYLSMRGGAQGSGTTIPDDSIPATDNYYANIGAPNWLSLSGSTDTFVHKYGFDVTPNDEAHAIYYNNGDLGIGRDMHCKTFLPPSNPATPGKACYVTNYGRIPPAILTKQGTPVFGSLDPQTAINEAIAGFTGQSGNQNIPVATVAMVYDPTNAANKVQFMVYNQDGFISDFAALDNPGLNAIAQPDQHWSGNIAVPNNCLTCHGSSSTYNPTTSGLSSITGATFLPFDPDSMIFSTSNSTYSKANMLPPLKALNAHIYDSAPKAAVTTLLKGMYGNTANGPKDAGSTFTSTYVPADWQSGGRAATQVYNEVVKPYCRTCHVSHDSTGGLDWATWTNFQNASPTIGFRACNMAGTAPMPQAEQTQNRFWKSPARAHLVNALSIGGACAP